MLVGGLLEGLEGAEYEVEDDEEEIIFFGRALSVA